MSVPSSPCIGVCTIDERHALCTGCGRTLDEIAAWGALSEPQRRAVMAELPARLTADDRPALDAEAGPPQVIGGLTRVAGGSSGWTGTN